MAKETSTFRWLLEAAPTERAFLEVFYLWIYTPRAHENGTVGKIIEQVLAFPHQPSAEAIQRTIDVFLDHDTADRLSQIAVLTLLGSAANRVPGLHSGVNQQVSDVWDTGNRRNS